MKEKHNMDNENMYKPRRKTKKKRKKVKTLSEAVRSIDIRIKLRKKLPSVLNQVHNQRSWELACS